MLGRALEKMHLTMQVTKVVLQGSENRSFKKKKKKNQITQFPYRTRVLKFFLKRSNTHDKRTAPFLHTNWRVFQLFPTE